MSEILKIYLIIHGLIGAVLFGVKCFDEADFFGGIARFLFWPIYLIIGTIKAIIWDIKNI